MGYLNNIKSYGLTALSVSSRIINNAGQTLYSMGQAMTYFKADQSPIGKVVTGIAVAGSVGSTALVKTVPTFHKFSDSTPPSTEAKTPLGWGGAIVNVSLQTSSLIYGGMTSLSGYFFTTQIGKMLALLGSKQTDVALWKEIMIQIGGLVVAASNFMNYYANDHRFIQQNAHTLGESIDNRHFALNAAMAKTLGMASLNLISYPMQAYFFAKPALKDLPYVGKYLGTVGTNALSGLASATTFMTVITWLPSIYKTFNASPALAESKAIIPSHCGTTSYKIASYTTGVIDSLAGNGLGPYMSVIFTLGEIAGVSPYGWVIGLGAVCALSAAGVNMGFSVIQGTNTTLDLWYKPKSEPSEATPLLIEPPKSDRIYRDGLPPNTVLFNPAENRPRTPLLLLKDKPENEPVELENKLGV